MGVKGEMGDWGYAREMCGIRTVLMFVCIVVMLELFVQWLEMDGIDATIICTRTSVCVYKAAISKFKIP